MTSVRITETYDLSTRLNKIGMIGIHTPSTGTIKGLYPGLWDSHKFVRLIKADITLACASMLPADPLQIGTEAGSIAPQDMFNPILYRAVTNESFDMIIGRLNTMASAATLPAGHNADISPTAFGSISGSANIYYSLLSERGWRKAMPQSGLSMKGLVPLVYPILDSFGNENQPVGNSNISNSIAAVDDAGKVTNSTNKRAMFRGRAQRMPRIPTKLGVPSLAEYAPVDSDIPNCFVGMLIVPPSKLHSLYYRLRVTWTISFEKVRSTNEYGSVSDISYNAGYVYYEYAPSSSKDEMEKDSSMVSSNDMDMDMIMQAGF